MTEPQYWHWLVLGILLMAFEIFAPSTLFLWLGFAALVVGVLLLLFPDLSLSMQMLLFAGLAVTAVLVGRQFLRRHPIATDEPLLNHRAEQYVGRVFTLDEPVINGVGKLKVDDSTWRIAGPDVVAGTQVKIIAADGVILHFEVA